MAVLSAVLRATDHHVREWEVALGTQSDGARLQSRRPEEVSHRSEVRFHAVHSVTPSQRPQLGEERGDMPPALNGRNTNGLQGGREQTRASLQRKFKQHFPDPAKKVGRNVGLSAETVDVYRQANVPQAWAQFAEVCKANPAFAIDILEDLGIDIDQDRNAYVLFLQLQKQVRGG
jgi:hypothetical protein